MSNAQTRGWGNPDAPNFRQNNIVKISGGGVSLWVHKEVAPVFEHFVTAISKHYKLDGYADDWSYINRDVRGLPGVKSNHSWGLAIDLNATANPMTADPKAKYEFRREIVNPLLARYKGKLIWGGDYKGERKDYMHFEFIGTPNEAKSICATLKPVAAPKSTEEEDMLKWNSIKVGDNIAAYIPGVRFDHIDGERWQMLCDLDLVNSETPREVNQRQWDLIKSMCSH